MQNKIQPKLENSTLADNHRLLMLVLMWGTCWKTGWGGITGVDPTEIPLKWNEGTSNYQKYRGFSSRYSAERDTVLDNLHPERRQLDQ